MATNKVGNGGKGVFCEGEPGTLLDLYENHNKFSIPGVDPFAIARERFEKLKNIAPTLGAQYLQRLNEFREATEFKSDIKLTEIDDSLHLFQPLSAKCEILQVAVRRNKISSSEKRFLIRKDLWDKMNVMGQAALITHEIIYEHFRKLGSEDSVKARQVNSFLYAEKLVKNDFWKMIKDLRIPLYP